MKAYKKIPSSFNGPKVHLDTLLVAEKFDLAVTLIKFIYLNTIYKFFYFMYFLKRFIIFT